MIDSVKALRRLIEKYVNGTCSPEEKQWVEAWLRFHRKKESEGSSSFDEREFKKEVMLERLVHQRAIGPMTYRVAAAIILLVASSLLFFHFRSAVYDRLNPVVWSVARADKGSILRFVLSDSSEISLNAGAALRYPNRFNGKTRELYLLDGEAYFQVKHESQRGFLVHAQTLTTQVLGTSFAISAYAQLPTVRVSVTAGKVGVTVNDGTKKPIFLVRDQQLTILKANRSSYMSHYALGDAPAWVSGDLSFYEQSLAEVLTQLENRYGVSFRWGNDKKKALIVNLSFSRNESLARILRVIALVSHTQIKKIDMRHYAIQ